MPAKRVGAKTAFRPTGGAQATADPQLLLARGHGRPRTLTARLAQALPGKRPGPVSGVSNGR